MPSKYPPTERVTPSRLSVGDHLLIRDRLSDQPYGTATINPDGRGSTPHPLATGVWTVTAIGSTLDEGRRRASRQYHLTVEHFDGDVRTLDSSPVQRFNRVIR